MFVATLTIPLLLAPAICMDEDNVGKSEITGTLFFASGVITLLQTTVGIRYGHNLIATDVELRFLWIVARVN